MSSKMILLLLCLCTSESIIAGSKAVQKDQGLRQEMSHISKKIRDMGPLIASETEFTLKTNKEKIVLALTELKNKFKNLKKHPTINLQGPSLNQAIMSEELTSVLSLIDKGKMIQGRAKLLSTLNLCISCHTQSPGKSEAKLFSDEDISTFKIAPIEKAELYFITRDYDKANSLYSDFLSKSTKTDDDELILKALERELIYYVKIKKDFKAGKEYFEKWITPQKFSDAITHEINDWIKLLTKGSLWENFDAVKATEVEMEKFLKSFMSDEEDGPVFAETNSTEVYDLNLSTILQEYYNAHPNSKSGGKILYWLAVIDKRINDDLFYSLGDFYLLLCMEKFSKDPISKECYDSYVDGMEINLVTHKKETEKKLQRLRKLINYRE